MAEPPEETAGSNAEEDLDRLLRGMTNASVLRNAEQMEALAAELMKAANEHALKNPSPDLSLEEDLESQARRGQWNEVIALREQLIERCRGRGEFHHVFRHERELATLLHHLNRPEDALIHARRATAAARQVDRMPVLVGQALLVESVCARRCGDFRQALQCVEESLAEIGIEDYAQNMRGGALVIRASCLLSVDDLTAAEADLEAAAAYLGIDADCPDLAGVQTRHAGWCEVQARRCGKRGEKARAVEWMIRALDLRQRAASNPLAGHFHTMAGLAGCLHQLAETYDEVGDLSDSATARQMRDRLLMELHLPAIPDKC
ncbi:MAG: hypothetical protein JNK85_30200 [Verrucomicrobiales bacterium]|nr:hypothetical protein [Verrucomicrobiales bacterium]